MPRATRRAPPAQRRPKATRQASVTTEDLRDEPRMMSEDEKRELILAHAAARANEKGPWGPGYFVAVVASCLVVATGWWMTLNANVRTVPWPQDPLVQGVSQSAKQFDQPLPASNAASVSAPADQIKLQFQQVIQTIKAAEAAAAAAPRATSTSLTK